MNSPSGRYQRRAPAVRELAIAAPAALAALLAGVLVARSAGAAIGVSAVAAWVGLAITRPRLLFAAGILLLAVEPARLLGATSAAGAPETYKLLLFACVLPIVLWRGLDPRKIGPVAAYVLVALTAGLFGTSLPGLTVSQTATSIATLSLAWIVFSVHWEWQRDRGLLKVLALTPAVTLAASAVLHVVSGLQLTTATHPVRLEGATLAAWLATVSLAATLSCLALFGRDRWRWSVPLAVLNLALLCATFTRGALLALLLATSPAIVRFARRRVAGQGLRLFAIALVALGAVIVLAPGVRERDAQATTHSVGGAGQHDLTSGRLRAWHFAYEQAKVNLLFGRGVGAGPVAGRSPGSPAGFVAQHNEYVRMLLEGGAVGALILLASMVAAVAACIRRAPSMMRSDLAAAGVAMAVYSITENTLSALPLAVALLLYIAIAGSESRHRRGELHGAT